MVSRTNQPVAGNWVNAVTRLLDRDNDPRERCELCNAGIASEHAHLFAPETRELLCACQPCALLFERDDAKRYQRVPTGARRLPGFDLPDRLWDAFMIPINLAFFFRDSPSARVQAMYPGPAGATESTLDLDAWSELVHANPELGDLEDDVEALLVNRVAGAREYYLVPIDRCYELVGLIRQSWHGLSGGEGVRDAVQAFFAGLRRVTSNGDDRARA